MILTSFSVKPNNEVYLGSVKLYDLKAFKSVKILSFAIFKHPVTTVFSRLKLVFKVLLSNFV